MKNIIIAAVLCCFSLYADAQTGGNPISGLPAAPNANLTDEFPVAQLTPSTRTGFTTRKVTLAQIEILLGIGTLTPNSPLIGNSSGFVGQGTRSGNTTTFATTNGALTNGHCVALDPNGNLIDAGAACGTGGGGGNAITGLIGDVAATGPGSVTALIQPGVVTGAKIASQTILNSNFPNQSANTVFAGPSSGAANFPSWRSLVGADLPSPFTSGTRSGNTSTFATTGGTITNGNCIQGDANGNIISTGTACGSGGGGGITALTGDVAASGSGSVVATIQSSAVTSSKIAAGTILSSNIASGTILPSNFPNQVANSIFAGPPSGGAATPSWRSLVGADLPSPFTSGTASGNTSKFVTTTGTLTSGHCVNIDANGNFKDAGTTCSPSPGGSSGQVQYNNSGAFGGLTNTQLTADINVFSNTLSGAVPASGGSSTSIFLAQNGTWQTPAGGGNVSTSGSITTGNCAQFTSATAITSASAPCGSGGGGGTNLGYINIKDYGATGDGTCHPLSSAYGTLAAAQAVYPFVSDLTQCIDWAATQQAINVAYAIAGVGGTNNSATVYCPIGEYQLSLPLFFDQPNNTQGSYAAWASGTTYAAGANVTYNGIPWFSAGSGNVGNPPAAGTGASYPVNLGLTFVNGSVLPFVPVSITNANPAVITMFSGWQFGAGSNFVVDEQAIVFYPQAYPTPGGGTPSLPTGLNPNQVYYVIGSTISGYNFQVSTTPGGPAVATSSLGTGTFFITPQVWYVAPNLNSSNFSNRVSFVGDNGEVSSSGCRFNSYMFNGAAIYLGPQNGVSVKSINLVFPTAFGNNVINRCGNWFMDGLAATNPSYTYTKHMGWGQADNNGGSHNAFLESVGAINYGYNYFVGIGNGQLGDSNTWMKPVFNAGCVGLTLGETQAFINTVYDGLESNNTIGIDGHIGGGIKVVGGNLSANGGASSSFTISSVTATQPSSAYVLLTATVASPDYYLQNPFCSYNAGYEYNANSGPSPALMYSPRGSSCVYNAFTIKTASYGVVPFFIGGFNVFTNQITLVAPLSWLAIYQGECCDSNLITQLQAATTLYATEAVTSLYGPIRADDIHIENGQATQLMCQCLTFGSTVAELKDIQYNEEASGGSFACCNQTPSGANAARFYAQQTMPFINGSGGDIRIDTIANGSNTFIGEYDRVLIQTSPVSYLEGRHTPLNVFPSPNLIKFDFLPVNPSGHIQLNNLTTTAGQLSGGYYFPPWAASGGGVWDNAAPFTAAAVASADVLNFNGPTDYADYWRTTGWGAVPTWGVRPAPYTHACITSAMAHSVFDLGSVPAITHVAQLHNNLVVSAGGSGYSVNQVLTLTGGTFSTPAQVTVTGVSGGAITSVMVFNTGTYTGTLPTSFGANTGAATFSNPIWFVNYSIPYPILWGGQTYEVCDYGNAITSTHYAYRSTNIGYSYFQNLTTTNVPNLSWTADGAAPFVYMNLEALELMFPGLVMTLTPDGTGGCAASAEQFMVLEVHSSLGYVKVIRADSDGQASYIPGWGANNSCKNTSIGMQAPNIVNPY